MTGATVQPEVICPLREVVAPASPQLAASHLSQTAFQLTSLARGCWHSHGRLAMEHGYFAGSIGKYRGELRVAPGCSPICEGFPDGLQ